MATLKYLATERAHLSQVPITEGQFIATTDTNEVFYDVAVDIRFKTNKLTLVDTDAERYRLSNNDQVSTDVIYYIKESELFYIWTGAWKNVVATTEITKFLGDYKNITPTTLVKGEERFAPLTIASQVFTDDGETVEAKVRQISHIASAFDSIVVTKKGKTFDIPVPFERYFDQPNMLLVYIGTLQIYPNRYSIEGNKITFQEEVEAGRTINFYFVYNAHAPKLETMNYIDGAYINKGTVPIDRMQKYSHSYTTNDATSVASSAAVKGLYDKMNALLDRGGIITKCVTKDDNTTMNTSLPNEYKLLDGNVISVRFHANVGNHATLRVDGKNIPIFIGYDPVKTGDIHAGDELYLQYDYLTERFYVTNGLPYLIDSTTYSYAVVADGENTFTFNALNYDPGVDRLEVFHNGVRLIQGKNFSFNSESKSISLVGYTADAGDVLEMVVYKVARSRATNNTQVTVVRPDFEELARSLGEALDEFKKKTNELNGRALDVIFPRYGDNNDSGDRGDCTIVGIDKAHWFMIDCFADSVSSVSSIKRCLQENHIDKLDFLLITHFHQDHIGNFEELIRSNLVKKVYVPDAAKTNTTSGTNGMDATTINGINVRLKAAADRATVPYEIAPNGKVDFNGAELTFYNNSDDDYTYYNTGAKHANNYNNLSIALMVKHIGRTFISEGDCLTEAMLHNVDIVPANVDLLKAHNHGLTNMPLAYKKISPKDAVILASRTELRKGTQFNYQSTLFDMGTNVYNLSSQPEDIHITYLADNGQVSYNTNLRRLYPNMVDTANKVYVDASYSDRIKTGDAATPFINLNELVRYLHSLNTSDVVNVVIKPGDYTTPSNCNVAAQVLEFNNIKPEVVITSWNGSVSFPYTLVKNSNITFDSIIFKSPSTVDLNLDRNMYNVKYLNSTGTIRRSTLNLDSATVKNELATNPTTIDFSNVLADSSNITLQSNTYSNDGKFAIKSSNSANVIITGNTNLITNSTGTVYCIDSGNIIVNGTMPLNTSNTLRKGGQLRFADINGATTISNISRGVVVETSVNNRFGGPQYYVSDGNGDFTSMDHFNIHGNTNMTPKFAGQFGYDPRSKKIKFAVANSNVSDWVEFANADTLSAAKNDLTNLINTTKSTLNQAISTNLTNTTSNINTVKQELTDLITTTTNTLKSNMEAAFANINTSIRKGFKGTAIYEPLIDWERLAKAKRCTVNDLMWVQTENLPHYKIFNLDQRLSLNGEYMVLYTKKNWMEYDEIIFKIRKNEYAMNNLVKVDFLKWCLQNNNTNTLIGNWAGYIQFNPMQRDKTAYNVNYTLTDATTFSIWALNCDIIEFYGVKYQ
jgi:beta-lactamase superfamily II metal-dependent hydrolase